LKTKVKAIKTRIMVVIGVLFLLFSCWLILFKFEGEKPQLSSNLTSNVVGVSSELKIDGIDKKSGLRSIQVGIVRNDEFITLKTEEYPGGDFFGGGGVQRKTVIVDFEPEKLNLTEGKTTLKIIARDYSWRGWLAGNETTISNTITIDTRSPRITLISREHNFSQGGSGCVVFKVSEACSKSGVKVGDNYFPAHPVELITGGDKKNNYIAFIGLRHDQGQATQIKIEVSDLAGNSSRMNVTGFIRNKTYKKDVINIPDRFLDRKMPEFDVKPVGNDQNPLVAKFLEINRNVRKANYLTITEWGEKSESALLWEGSFLRMPKSARKAGFADHREYRYNGALIDQQVHLGIDLASVAYSPVPAANSGKVLFADNIGIYGNTVILDHGFGLISTYSHLSGFAVDIGKFVKKGEIIGNTGTTGLAGGDHLHFGMMVHNIFVDPVEWWDAKWIENNISAKTRLLKTN
jgi:hypothetical protein